MAIEVKLKNKFFDKYAKDTQSKIADVITKGVLSIERSAKGNCPVDTGNLRASINSSVEKGSDGVTGQVGTAVEYAQFVELGTKKQSAKPYLYPALKEHEQTIKTELAKALGGK